MEAEYPYDPLAQAEHAADTPPPATISTVTIDGRTFVAGLFWQSLSRLRGYEKEARQIGQRENMDVVTIRFGAIMQAGFAPKNRGAGKGMYSLASALSAKLGKSFIGAFDLGDGRCAMLAVHAGSIVPGSDVIDLHEAIHARMRYYFSAAPSWDKIYAPAAFDMGGESAQIADLLKAGALTKAQWKATQLRPLAFGGRRDEILRLGIYGALAAFAYVAYTQWDEKNQREAQALAEMNRRAEQQRLQAQTKEAAPVAPEHPWGKEPPAADFVERCVASIEDLRLSMGGWVFESASCDATTLVGRYKRVDPATANGFTDDLARFVDAEPVFAADYSSAVINLPVKMLPAGDEPLRPVTQALADLSSHFQAAGVPFVLEEARTAAPPPPPAAPGQPPAPAMLAPDWKTWRFSLTGEREPKSLIAGLPLQGVRFKSIDVKLSQDTAKLEWIIKGNLYGK